MLQNDYKKNLQELAKAQIQNNKLKAFTRLKKAVLDELNRKSKIQHSNEPCKCGSGLLFKNCCKLKKKNNFKGGMTYLATGTYGQKVYLIGINVKKNKCCNASFPPTVYNLSSFKDFKEMAYITTEQLNYRDAKFGQDWD